MIVDYAAGGGSPLAAIVAQIVNARNGGNWDQSGITSSAARDASPSNTTLGVLEGSEYLVLNGPGATFFDFPVDDSSVLVRYTFYGDTDFNGVVNFDDYALIDLAFNTQGGESVGGGGLQVVPEPSLVGVAAGVVAAIFPTRNTRRRRARPRT